LLPGSDFCGKPVPNLPAGWPVRAVLEMIAGTTRKLGIAPGDRVVHPIFGGRERHEPIGGSPEC